MRGPTVRFGTYYHWSLDQYEYATDVVFKRQADLAAVYGNLTRTTIHTVKQDTIATKLHSRFEGESGNRYNIRERIFQRGKKLQIAAVDSFQ